MAQNLQLDPIKKDYVVVAGSSVPSDRVLEACYYALLIPQNNWLYGDPSQGSLLYTLEGVKRTSTIEQEFAGYAQAALNSQVIGTGKATATAIKNLQATPTGSSNQIGVVPSNVQLSNQLNFVSVG